MMQNNKSPKPLEIILFGISAITASFFLIFIYYFLKDILGAEEDSVFTTRNGVLSFMLSFFSFYQANKMQRKRTEIASTRNYAIISLYFLTTIFIVVPILGLVIFGVFIYCL